jgi:4-hydroxy-tetrahydrodipicolinate synthase
MSLKTLYTALITPFTEKDQLDEESLRRHLQFQLAQGIEGIVLLGTTGETPTLSEEEKERIIKIGVEELKGNAHLLIGTGSYSTRRTIEQTAQAKEWGADGALIVAPYYNKPTQEGLFLHYKMISDQVNFPICVYNISGRAGVNIHTETLKRIAPLRNIVGVKEASGQISQMADLIESILPEHPDFKVLSGDDSLTLPLMALGGHGLISVTSNLLPATVKKLLDLTLNNDFTNARDLHYQLSPLFKALFTETNPIPIKAAMNILGKYVGDCRPPLCSLSPLNREKLEQLLKQLPFSS